MSYYNKNGCLIKVKLINKMDIISTLKDETRYYSF